MKLYSLLLVVLLSSCLTQKKIDEICSKCPRHDSIVIKETVKVTPFDTTLYLSQMGKDLMFDFSGDCCSVMDSLFAQMGRSNGTITTVDNGIKSSVFKKDKKIVFRCEADSLKEVIRGLRTTIEKSSEKVTTVTVEEKCIKEHTKWYDVYARWWLLISLFLILLLIGWKYGKTMLKIFPFK